MVGIQPGEIGRFIRPKQLSDLLGVSLVTVWRMRARGDLPPPTRVSRGCVGWPEATIAEWLRRRQEDAR